MKAKCKFCRKSLYKERRCFNENLKLGYNFYCSKPCSYKYRRTGREIVCENGLCKNKFYRALNGILAHNYCSRTCAAIINNLKFPKWPKRFCSTCKKEFKNRQSRYCSTRCGKMGRFKYMKEEIILAIKKSAKELGRTPTKRELKEISDKSINMFGSWNNTIEAAGLIPNRPHDHRMYKRTKTKAADGHLCDSVSEATIDNWLTENKIPHKRNTHYPTSKHLADWSIDDKVFIEYFGLAKDSPRYDKSIREKKKLCKQHKIKLIAIYPDDLYPKIRLKKEFFI